MEVYRQALFLGELAWHDTAKITRFGVHYSLADQLYRSAGSTCANISEGFSRLTKADQLRFYGYSLGSARETRDHYIFARHILGEAVMTHRVAFVTGIVRQLLQIINSYKGDSKHFREDGEDYEA